MTQSTNQRELARRSAGVHAAHKASKALAAAVSTFIVFAPMLEKAAMAQPQSAQTDPPKAEHTVRGNELTITAGEKSIKVYTKYFIGESDQIGDPVLEVEGPARFTVRFYPVVKRDQFSEGKETYERDLLYSFGEAGESEGVEQTTKMETRISPYTASGDYVDTLNFVIGTPVEITKEVGEGKHRFSVLSPNGFFELVSVEAVVVEKPPAEPPARRVIETPKAPEPVNAAPVKETPAKEYDKPVVLFDAERTWLNTPDNTGDMNYWQRRANIWFDDNWALVAGGMSSSYALKLDSDTTQTIFRSFSFDASLGLAYWNDGHSVYAMANAGYRGMISTTVLFAGESSPNGVRDVTDHFKIGGQAGYRFKHNLVLDASVVNNPFNPVKGRLYGMLPAGWISGGHSNPWIEVNSLWLRTMSPLPSADFAGAAELGSDNLYMRALAGIPIWEFGTIVPSVIGGGEFFYPLVRGPEDGLSGNFYAGGSLKSSSVLDGDAGRLEVEAGALGNTKGATIMLKLGHSR